MHEPAWSANGSKRPWNATILGDATRDLKHLCATVGRRRHKAWP